MGKLTIHPLHLGSITGDMSTFTYLRNQGQAVTFPVFAWYIAGADTSILVDTGAPPPEELPIPRTNYVQPPEQSIERALAKIGVRPDEIETVVLTHLHWDHCLNVAMFPRARFIVQRAELRYAVAPLPVHVRLFSSYAPGTRAFLPTNARVDAIDGDRGLTKGVSLHLLPGHTPGLQGVRVETDESVYLIASDNVPFDVNWAGEPPEVPHIPSTLHVDLEAYTASLTRMESLADRVLAGHEPNILQRAVYG